MRVFLSYDSRDKQLASLLARSLASSGFDVWHHEGRVLPGDNWARKVAEALEHSDAMVVLVSPQSMRSRFVREEINYALGSSKYAGRVVPVLVRPTDEMPWYLKKLSLVRVGKDRAEVGRRVIDALQGKQG